MITVTIRNGISNSITKEYNQGSVVGDILEDTALLGVLNATENMSAVSDSETLDLDDKLYNGQVIYLESRASSKA